jgi:uncharacterized protein
VNSRRSTEAMGWGAVIGVLGGLVGLGGAEFRLPLLLGPFRFRPLDAVIVNKAISLVVVAAALLFRTRSVPAVEIATHGSVVANLLGGSLAGAWVGASQATRLRTETFYRLIAVLLLAIAGLLLAGHEAVGGSALAIAPPGLYVAGMVAGFLIGVIAALMGVAGGEFIIPTLVLLFGLDVKVAGSLSLAISLPTMITGFVRYSQDRSFVVLKTNRAFVLFMAAGSILGALCGGLLLGIVPTRYLLPILALILVISAIRVWQHAQTSVAAALANEGAFGFEPEAVRALTYIPLRLRMKLDLCGVHLPQRQWNALPIPARESLMSTPCRSDSEVARFREALASSLRRAGAGEVRDLGKQETAWRSRDVPAQVLSMLQSLRLPTISAATWRTLSDDRRFALVKLTRQGHVRNLESALREFGLIRTRP